MKTTIIALTLFCLCFSAMGQRRNNTIYIQGTPDDRGLGLRYDRHFDDWGAYASITKGAYYFFEDGYIKDHIRSSIGYMIPIYCSPSRRYVSIGLVYHSYGKTYKTDMLRSIAIIPASLELGFAQKYNRFAFSFTMDIFKFEACAGFGLNF